MKKMRQILTFLVLFSSFVGFSQQADECNIKYNLFKGEYKAGKYANAFNDWMWCMDNCPKLSVNIYKYGIKIAEHRLETASPLEKEAAIQLVERVYLQRLEHFPQDKADIYNDLATFKAEQDASQEEVFSWLDKSFKADAGEMSAKNYYRYFDIILNMYKDNEPQKVFDSYDQVTEALELKREDYTKKIDEINEKDSLTLSSKDKNSREVYQQILTNISIVESGLDVKLSAISNCDNLIPLNKKYFEEKKTDPVWLRRAVSRMYNKECTDDPFYDTLVEAYVKADPSPQASVFYAGILMKKGETNKAMDYFKQAVDQEPDTYKKANYLLKIAQILSKQGRKSEARANCYKALEYAPTLGNAYLLISSLYASSANSCGDDLVSKRMVYVAALNMAQKAKAVDPSIASTANKYISSYAENIPTKKDLFVAGVESGTKHTIGCWINTTVIVP
jgi:tetratricopeptide (TPR) repeat protein